MGHIKLPVFIEGETESDPFRTGYFLFDSSRCYLGTLSFGVPNIEHIAPEIATALNERPALIAQRDALVGACEAAGDYLGGIAYHHPHLVTDEIMETLRAALALVRQEDANA